MIITKVKIKKEHAPTLQRTRFFIAASAILIIGIFLGAVFRPWPTKSPRPNDAAEIASTKRMQTCEVIEQKMTEWIYPEMRANTFDLAHNAETYSRLSIHGCPENAAKFKELALRQLEIANAMNDGDIREYQFDDYESRQFHVIRIRVLKNLAPDIAAREGLRVIERAYGFMASAQSPVTIQEFIYEIEGILVD
ncbi:MAG: hypothetical protein FWG18_01430 [Alphaproteobacteria bacterium]|nr:hypothetical protein [Alphaproteobacteria bacterium]